MAIGVADLTDTDIRTTRAVFLTHIPTEAMATRTTTEDTRTRITTEATGTRIIDRITRTIEDIHTVRYGLIIMDTGILIPDRTITAFIDADKSGVGKKHATSRRFIP